MRLNRNRRSILARAAMSALYANTDGGGGAATAAPAAAPATPAAPPAKDPKKIELTEDEIQARIDAAVKKRDDDAAKKDADAKAKAEEEEAKKRGEFEKIAATAEEKRKAAEDKAAASERRAQLAEVKGQLHDHLADKHPDYVRNATDIMLHVEKKLPADAKPDDIAKLIEEEAKSFVERTPRASSTSGAPGGATRGKIPSGTVVPPPDDKNKNGVNQKSFTRSRF